MMGSRRRAGARFVCGFLPVIFAAVGCASLDPGGFPPADDSRHPSAKFLYDISKCVADFTAEKRRLELGMAVYVAAHEARESPEQLERVALECRALRENNFRTGYFRLPSPAELKQYSSDQFTALTDRMRDRNYACEGPSVGGWVGILIMLGIESGFQQCVAGNGKQWLGFGFGPGVSAGAGAAITIGGLESRGKRYADGPVDFKAHSVEQSFMGAWSCLCVFGGPYPQDTSPVTSSHSRFTGIVIPGLLYGVLGGSYRMDFVIIPLPPRRNWVLRYYDIALPKPAPKPPSKSGKNPPRKRD